MATGCQTLENNWLPDAGQKQKTGSRLPVAKKEDWPPAAGYRLPKKQKMAPGYRMPVAKII
jgi:hypothetical protein